MYQPSDHSFVVCAYGESPYLAACLDSLLSQTVRTKITITTATPNDLIRQVAREKGVPLVVNPAKPGIGSDWNFGVSQAGTPLVTIAHQDDVYAPAYVERMLAGMNAAPRPLIFFTNYGELRGGKEVDDSRLLRIKRRLLRPIQRHGGISSEERVKHGILSIGSSICCPTVTLNMTYLPNPPFVSKMQSNLDWETWEGFSHLEGAFVYDERILLHHRIHEGSATSRLIRDGGRTAEDLAMLQKFWPKPVARLMNVFYSRGQASNG